MLHNLIKKLHIYSGLLSFTILLIFGVVGLMATMHGPPESRPKPVFESRRVAFTAPPDLADPKLAGAVYRFLDPPLTNPPPSHNIHRDENNNLTFRLYSANGIQQITVLEDEGQVEIATHRSTFWGFLNSLHATTIRSRVSDLPVRMWTWYNEFSIWALIFMALSGLYLWLASRPRYRLAQASFAAGCAVTFFVYFALR